MLHASSEPVSPPRAKLADAFAGFEFTELLLPIIAIPVLLQQRSALPQTVFLAVGCLVAERVWPYRPQRFARKGLRTDLYHLFITQMAGFSVGVALAGLLAYPLRSALNPVLGAVGFHRQPEALQVIAAILIADLCVYGQHRLQHRIGWLWRFHAVHHSSENLDWLAAYRQHPVDLMLFKFGALVPLFVLNAPAVPIAIYIGVNSVVATVAHINVDLRLGRFWWIVRSPQFHRWHHANQRDAYDRNFAELLPLWDIVFRTAYLPRGREAERYGIPEPIPIGYVGQMTEPFRRRSRRAT